EATIQLGFEALRQFRELSGLAISSPLLRRLPPWRRSVQRYKSKQARLLEIIESICRNKSASRTTFCGHLLATRERFDLSLEDVKGNAALAFLFAARSTAAVLANMLHYLSDNPQWQERVRNSSDAASGRQLLRAVVSESLRLNPVVPFIVRIAERDCKIAGMNLSRGDQVMATGLLTHYREANFPSAEKFDPTRFLDEKISNHEFIPFGGGKTHCIGSGLVYSIATGFLKLVAAGYECERTSGSPEDDKFVFQGVLCARSNCHFRLVPRVDLTPSPASDQKLFTDNRQLVSA
ncbi:MAG: cytochrome P450, partial [Planctomycetales bacterium]|nr:cytochrome P450 [Planctomycetales bacterium]